MVSRSPTFMLAVPLSFLLGGCAATNNYDNASNPFEELEQRQPLSAGIVIPPVSSTVTTANPIQKPSSASSEGELVGAVATAIPAGQDRGIETQGGSGQAGSYIQDMIAEANRLGTIGDYQGKAELLSQAGYSGSSEAFYVLARMYLDGTLPHDMDQALHFINLSHSAGYAEATRVLGMLYLRGQGVPADERYGRMLLELASKSSPRAAREYGMLLMNLQKPHLNDPALGMEYLRDASVRGDSEATVALGKALGFEAVPEGSIHSMQTPSPGVVSPHEQMKAKAMRGDASAMYQYAQKVLIGAIPIPEPEFTAYCWLSVAELLGNDEARKELALIRGVRAISDSKAPGRLDQCIDDLHYQVLGQDSTGPSGSTQ
ncbi:tetratricopeptide repeat protein [Pseudomonas aeruginosa]|uniref:tetratricopeptide repeat protein n=1 Tax=Pseudomonas aeruginosa TaxID=287 RepID=UPI0034E097DE